MALRWASKRRATEMLMHLLMLGMGGICVHLWLGSQSTRRCGPATGVLHEMSCRLRRVGGAVGRRLMMLLLVGRKGRIDRSGLNPAMWGCRRLLLLLLLLLRCSVGDIPGMALLRH